MIPADALDVQAEFDLLRDELRAYSEELAEKPFCVVLTKTDLLPPDWEVPHIDAPGAWAQYAISAVSHQGLNELLEGLWTRVRKITEEQDLKAEEDWRP
jgi:GTP-binding protein